MKNILFPLAAIVLASCSEKATVTVISNGEFVKGATASSFSINKGNSYLQQEIVMGSNDKLTAKTTAGDKEAPLSGAGYYVWNLRTDTLIGSIQRINAGNTTDQTITQEKLKHTIDSLQNLLNNNISGSTAFFVAPGALQKLTSGSDVYFVGPFNGLPAQLDENIVSENTEVFKFYTSKDVREQIERLKGFLE